MDFADAMEQALLERDLPVIAFYDFFTLGHQLFTAGTWKGENIDPLPEFWDRSMANAALKRLDKKRTLVPDADFRSGVWRVAQSTQGGYAQDIVCMVDPYAHVSHLSAMEAYGLTDRTPRALHLTTPKREVWKDFQAKLIRRDLIGLDSARIPVFRRPGIGDEVRRRPIAIHETALPWDPMSLAGRQTRVTTIGQTFADMLVTPRLCGGMHHVIDVWEAEAKDWEDEIVDAVRQLDNKIATVRAGYLLSELLGLENPVFSEWEAFSQRGGSRKLDPDSEYVPKHSRRWGISLNAY